MKNELRMLCQLQLSNYDTSGVWILEADSGFQMMLGRARTMLQLDTRLKIDIIGPKRSTLKTQPEDVTDVFKTFKDRINWIEIDLIPNALVTRYDFDFKHIATRLNLSKNFYDVVYINDPMLLRNYKALFHVEGKYQPKFVVHSHFVDEPTKPKFPAAASLWMGQCEAARKADFNFWQCGSAMEAFFEQFSKEYSSDIVYDVRRKSEPWDDGYSSDEILTPFKAANLRFDDKKFAHLLSSKKVIFVPNRIGGLGRSSDYTGCGKFMFESLPKLAELRKKSVGFIDYVVICGNPSQKILNHELEEMCGEFGYVNLVKDSLNRDEFKFIAQNSDIAVGTYVVDAYGGTAARECIELGCLPFWANVNEYAHLATVSMWPEQYMCDISLNDIPEKLSLMLDNLTNLLEHPTHRRLLRETVRDVCSYERTTEQALRIIHKLCG